jgi:hypothetical protein
MVLHTLHSQNRLETHSWSSERRFRAETVEKVESRNFNATALAGNFELEYPPMSKGLYQWNKRLW